jgi:mannosyltransferase OCH1-like enzyme
MTTLTALKSMVKSLSYRNIVGSISALNSEVKNKSRKLGDGEVKIPKEVFQTWKTNIIPQHWAESPKAIMNLMPDWHYTLMTDEDNRKFVEENFPDFLQYYDAFDHNIMRADAIRYMWLYKIGGIYLDLDMQVMKPLDELFYEDKDIYVVSSGNFGNFYTNAFMASKPGVKLWLDCIERMKQPYSMLAMGKHLKVMTKTGPMMFTKAVKKSTNSRYEMPAKLITSCDVCSPKPCNIENGYMRILQGSSWVEADTQVYTWCTCNSGKIFVMILVIVVIGLIVWRYSRK